MSIIINGFVKNGVVVPHSPLPEGAQVEIQLTSAQPEVSPDAAAGVSPSELRKMPTTAFSSRRASSSCRDSGYRFTM
jgi:hypothetical protein